MKDNNIKNVLSKTFCVTYNILHNIHNSLLETIICIIRFM